MSSHRPPEGLATAVAAASAVVATLAAVGFVVAYVVLERGPRTPVLGATLAVALGALGIGLVTWARALMPQGPHVEERHDPEPDPDARARVEDVVTTGAEGVGRRRLLGRLFAVGAGAVGLAAASPLLSLGPDAFPERRRSGWRAGLRLVREDGSAVAADELPIGAAVTVFPQGSTREDEAHAQTMLIRLAAANDDLGNTSLDPATTAAGHVAYSRLCTHMGCPVGLYQTEERRLVCPCHQSAFDVIDGARPRFGPATRPLPQLPLGVDDEGFLVATADYATPVGTGFWTTPAGTGDDRDDE